MRRYTADMSNTPRTDKAASAIMGAITGLWILQSLDRRNRRTTEPNRRSGEAKDGKTATPFQHHDRYP